ncbi:unnamed protein product [Cuscuta campestris]|uniref:Dirigent protein n=2 Tax=Cuscuta sect. Cleistogrammica TaxID=1824901 RepID=A0A484LCV6_9ASTE|nr:hypothetical protein DM860_005211 [Cuscuta australis]VFQ74026.1 unnamed protein product [Cuscuta campestris]
MGKMGVVALMLVCILVGASAAVPVVSGVAFGPGGVDQWFEKLPKAKPKITKLHFYYHDIVTGNKPTAYQIAESNFTGKSTTRFGALSVMDDLLTETPDPRSKVVGRGQGTYGFTGVDEVSLLMVLNFFFTGGGEFNGSTLSILGRNAYYNEYREMPIVGGTGVFRLASGIATAQTNYFNLTSDNAIVEYNLVVLHYDFE